PDGRRYAQIDQPLTTSQWAAGRYVATELPFPIPADAPPGAYRLLVGLYDPATGQRLPLRGATAADPALSGPDALELLQLSVR
ncbi:MAG: glycosyl transferase, partial [Chloroflexales bacterium]|nr:glycosyl transferase [Chloroflexales bacterium]